MLAATVWQPVSYRGAPAVESVALDGARIVVLLRGGQLVSWKDAHGTEHLYVSPLADPTGELPVRGGVPVIFPQFGALGMLPRHGFARMADWQPLPNQLALQWTHNADTTALWPNDCRCEMAFDFLPKGLQLTFTVTNTGEHSGTGPLTFSAALHSYLAASSQEASIAGFTPEASPLPLHGHMDDMLFDVPPVLDIHTGARRLKTTRSGFSDLVLWNPGTEIDLADLPAGEASKFVCVEAAQLTAVELAAGQSWRGSERWQLV